MAQDYKIQNCTAADYQAVADIYNQYIPQNGYTMDATLKTSADIQQWVKKFNEDLDRDYIFQDDLGKRDPKLLRAIRSQAPTKGGSIEDYIKPQDERTNLEIAVLTEDEINKIKRLHPAICRRRVEIENGELFAKFEA